MFSIFVYLFIRDRELLYFLNVLKAEPISTVLLMNIQYFKGLLWWIQNWTGKEKYTESLLNKGGNHRSYLLKLHWNLLLFRLVRYILMLLCIYINIRTNDTCSPCKTEFPVFFYFITYDLVYLLLFWQIRILPLRILVNSHDKDDYIYKAKLSWNIISLVCILWFAVQTFYALKEEEKKNYQALHRVSTGRPLWMV